MCCVQHDKETQEHRLTRKALVEVEEKYDMLNKSKSSYLSL